MTTEDMKSIPVGTIVTPTLIDEEGRRYVAGVYRVAKTLDRDLILAMLTTPDEAPCEDFDVEDLVRHGYLARVEFVNVDIAPHHEHCSIEPDFGSEADRGTVATNPPF